jgi:membrane protease YdiL (CAAX protease family)
LSDPHSDAGDRPATIHEGTAREAPDDAPGIPRRGSRIFSLEDRAAPGLYLVGWLGTVIGLGIVGIAGLSTGNAGPLLISGLIVLALGLLAAAGAQALERSRRRDLAYRGPSPWLVFAAVVPLTVLAVVAVLVPLGRLGLDPLSPTATAVGLAATALVYASAVRLLVVGTGALRWADMGLSLPPRQVLVDLVYGASFGVPVIFVTGLLAAFLQLFLSLPPSPLPAASDATGVVANLASAVVIAPIGEELFFRGFATTAWARTAGPRAAIVRGALFFAFAHVVTLFDTDFAMGFQRALFAFLVRIPVGLVLGWVYLNRRSLPASIGTHATFNGVTLLLQVLVTR